MKKRESFNYYAKLTMGMELGLIAILICAIAVLEFLVGGSRSTRLYYCLACGLVFVGAEIFICRVYINGVYKPVEKLNTTLSAMLKTSQADGTQESDGGEATLSAISENIDYLTNKMKEHARQEYEVKLLLKQSELNALQMQITPHFLYNTLDSIRGIAVNNNQREIAQMTKALSGIFRYSISKSNGLSTVLEEIKNVENYMTIQQMRFDNKFVLKKEFDDDELLMSADIPKMTLQPIVENAVFHGLEPKMGKGSLTIRMYMTEKRLIITVNDDGVGIEPEKLKKLRVQLENNAEHETGEKHFGIALKNVNERIRLFYGDRYGLSISSTPGVGTSVEIVLPIESHAASAK